MSEEAQGQSQSGASDSGTPTAVRRTEDGNFVLRVNGQDQVMTADQFVEAYQKVQKGVAAERRFEEAAAKEKRLGELVRLADSGDAQAYQQLLGLSGYDQEAIQEKVAAYQQAWASLDGGEDEEAEEEPPRRKPKGEPEKPRKLGLEDLDPALQQELAEQRKARLASVREKIFSETQEALAKDGFLGKIVGKGGSRAAKLLEQAKKTVRGRIRDGEDYGPRMLDEVVKELRDFVEEFGAGAVPTSIPGLGPGPGISHAEASAERPPEPVLITDPNYRKNFRQRLAHMVTESMMGD